MALTKKIQYFGADTGKTIYGLIMRCRDGAFLDSDYHFRETPVAPARIFAEKTISAMASKIYEFSMLLMSGRMDSIRYFFTRK